MYISTFLFHPRRPSKHDQRHIPIDCPLLASYLLAICLYILYPPATWKSFNLKTLCAADAEGRHLEHPLVSTSPRYQKRSENRRDGCIGSKRCGHSDIHSLVISQSQLPLTIYIAVSLDTVYKTKCFEPTLSLASALRLATFETSTRSY